jgi:hypothetical protein
MMSLPLGTGALTAVQILALKAIHFGRQSEAAEHELGVPIAALKPGDEVRSHAVLGFNLPARHCFDTQPLGGAALQG